MCTSSHGKLWTPVQLSKDSSKLCYRNTVVKVKCEIPNQIEPVNPVSEGEQMRHFLTSSCKRALWFGGVWVWVCALESVKTVGETLSLAHSSGAGVFSGLVCFEAALKTEFWSFQFIGSCCFAWSTCCTYSLEHLHWQLPLFKKTGSRLQPERTKQYKHRNRKKKYACWVGIAAECKQSCQIGTVWVWQYKQWCIHDFWCAIPPSF